MPKFIFEVDRTYTWNIEVEADTKEEAEKKMWETEVFDDDNAQRGYLEIVDTKEE